MTLPRIWLSLPFIIVLLGACATVPEPLRGEFPALTPQRAANENLNDQRARWGGQIIDTRTEKDQTCFEIIGWSLSDTGRPIPGSSGQGRFLTCAPGFYDPAVYTRGREVTVVGTTNRAETRKIGDYDYRYPRLAADQLYLWPEREVYAGDPYYPYYYNSFFYPSFFHGFHGPFHRHPIIVPRPPNNTPPATRPPLPFPPPGVGVQRPKPPPAVRPVPPFPPRMTVPRPSAPPSFPGFSRPAPSFTR